MNAKEETLGGRLPLLDPTELTADQRPFYDASRDHVLPWAEQMGFAAATGDQRLIGPFNAMLRSPRISMARSAFVAAEREHTALSPSVREVVILTMGAIWQAEYELYAHRAAGAHAGLQPKIIEALARGDTPEGLAREERLAHEVARALILHHSLEADRYEAAVKAFGEQGLVDLIYLAGNYVTTSLLLKAFAVPAPASATSGKSSEV